MIHIEVKSHFDYNVKEDKRIFFLQFNVMPVITFEPENEKMECEIGKQYYVAVHPMFTRNSLAKALRSMAYKIQHDK